MNVYREPREGGETFGFEVPNSLTEAVSGIGDPDIKRNFLQTVAEEGLGEEALRISPIYIRGIEARLGEEAEKVADPELKRALQLRQRVIPQIALAVMLLEADEGDESVGVLGDVFTVLDQEISEQAPAYRNYFQALLDSL